MYAQCLCLLVLLQSPVVNDAAAVVNGEKIPLHVVDTLAKEIRSTYGAGLSQKEARELVLRDLIKNRLLMQFLVKHGPKIDAAEGEKIIAANLLVLQSQKKTLADYALETKQTEAQVRGDWLLQSQLARYLESQQSEAILRQHFDANKDYYARSRIKAQLIAHRIPSTASQADRAAAKAKVSQWKADIEAKKISFTDVAKKFSVDPRAPLGGDYGFLSVDDPRWEDAVLRAGFALSPGQVSEPVETEYCVYLVTVTERDPGKQVTFDQVQEVVKSRVTIELLEKLIKTLHAEAKIQILLPE